MQWCLNIHAPYRCRHVGACCRASWVIPFEDGTIASRDASGACTFLDGPTRLCSLHRDGGIQTLPLTCRMFPRIVLQDARGTFISLSHFCPTAAALLFDAPGEIAIVEAPPALGEIGELDGLDARDVWPPLLRPRVLMDLAAYGAWERRALDVLTRGDATPRTALDALADATSHIAAWTPGSSALLDTVHGAFDALGEPRTVAGSAAEIEKEDASGAVKRWLSARLFGAWIAYQGDGLAATIAYLRSCLDTFERELEADGSALESIRRSDLRILHGAERWPFTARHGRQETTRPEEDNAGD